LIGVDGEVEVSGKGHGDDTPSPEAEAVIRDLLKDKPELVDKVIEYLKSQKANKPVVGAVVN
jgi:hypothetical protein